MSLLPVETKIRIPSPELTELLSSNLSLKELAETWLSLGQEYSIEMGNGLNDEEEFSALCLQLSKGVEQGSEVLAELYYSIEETKKCFSSIKLIEEFMVPITTVEKFKPNFTVDDDKLDEYEKSKGFYFHEWFAGTACNFREAIPFMLMHALSNGGGASLSYLPDSHYEEMLISEDDEEMENEGNVLYCHSYFSDLVSGFGINGRHFFIKE